MLFVRIIVAVCVSALGVSFPAFAQTTYRWVDKTTGQTVYSDLPPPQGVSAVEIKSRVPAPPEGEDTSLPFATRQAVQKYPVTLYTAANCIETCKLGRNFLNARGVPFSEKMIGTEEEIAALTQKLGSSPAMPTLFVGTQPFVGFETQAWTNLLDLAGYPANAPSNTKPSGAFTK